MKTFKGLFPQIGSFANLFQAALRARKQKKETPEMARFHFHLEGELFKLQQELKEKTYVPGPYQTFTIYDPKTRLISAAPYRDRVVHHALCQVIEPVFEPTFIFDSYANRVGKGSHKAIERFQQYARKYPYVLKCDIKKFFPSVDHAVLKKELRWKVACADTLWLIDTIIDHSNPQEPHHAYFPGDHLFSPLERRRGLPIGNLTSQFWANVYMNRFDHFVKEQLRVPGYIRYVDDFVLFSDRKAQLWSWKKAILHYLVGLRLLLHPHKTHIYHTRKGVPFLGFQVFPHHRYVSKAKVWRYRRHLRKQIHKQTGPPDEGFMAGINSWLGHIRFGQSERLETQTFSYLYRKGLRLQKRPSGSWGRVEQQQ
jgi:retron-type reverse transcriptase